MISQNGGLSLAFSIILSIKFYWSSVKYKNNQQGLQFFKIQDLCTTQSTQKWDLTLILWERVTFNHSPFQQWLIRHTLWVRNNPHLWLLPHNSSSLWGNAMKFYDYVPLLTKIGVSGWINIKVNKQQSCIQPSVRRGCVHTHTLTVELLRAICRGCGGTHALQRSEICPLRAVRCGCGGTHTFWRARIESFPSVPVLSAVISLRSFTGTAHYSCFFGGSGFDGNFKSSAVCN